MKKKMIIGATIIALLSGGSGVFAGSLIKQGKTPRGNHYSVEKEELEKNKFQVSVNGKVISNTIISQGKTIYVPLKSLPKSKFTLNYNKEKWAYDLKTVEQFELSRDIKNFNKLHTTVFSKYKDADQTFQKLYSSLVISNGQFNINEALNASEEVTKATENISKQASELDIIYSRVNVNKAEYMVFLKQTKKYFGEYKRVHVVMSSIITEFQDITNQYSQEDLIPTEELKKLDSLIKGFKSQYEKIPYNVTHSGDDGRFNIGHNNPLLR